MDKIQRSTYKDALSEQCNEVQDLMDKGQSVLDILRALCSTSLSHAQVLEASQSASENSVRLSTTMAVAKWSHEELQQILFNHFDDALAMLMKGSAGLLCLAAWGRP